MDEREEGHTGRHDGRMDERKEGNIGRQDGHGRKE